MRRGVLVVLLSLAACEGGTEQSDGGFFVRDTGTGSPTDAGMIAHDQILVTAVFDGDTMRVSAGSSVRAPDGRPLNGTSIRFLGINAPEIAHPGIPEECWGPESADATKGMLLGKIITLRFDQSQIRDDFDRLLAYVVAPDDSVANEELIRQGNACSFRRYPHPDTAKYNALETEAKNAKRGMWSCPAAQQRWDNCR